MGVINAAEFRDAVLRQRQKALDAEQSADPPAPGGAGGIADILSEIRDILARMEARG
jgi:hypothetical protein